MSLGKRSNRGDILVHNIECTHKWGRGRVGGRGRLKATLETGTGGQYFKNYYILRYDIYEFLGRFREGHDRPVYLEPSVNCVWLLNWY